MILRARAIVVRGTALTGLMLLLGACAAPVLRPDSASLAAQELRERELATQPDWSLTARLAVSSADDGGSGSLEWQQRGPDFRFAVHAPVTGKTWVLSGDNRHAVLEGLRAEPLHGADAEKLLERELGWQVPLAELRSWVRGVRAPGRAELLFRSDGLPAELAQAGWIVEYRDYDLTQQPPLPRKIFARRGDYRVRLVVQRWQMP